MDREQEEMQFLGLLDIYIESHKLIFSCKKLFTQITLSLILPLSFIFLAHMEVSSLLFSTILRNEFELDSTRPDTIRYRKISDLLESEWLTFLLFKFAYFSFLLVLSLLSTSAVVYTVACVYTARDAGFKKVMSVVPKVWKRLVVTFLCAFAAFFAYNVVALLAVIVWALKLGDTEVAGLASLVILAVAYATGFVYLTVVWQLGSVVSVLEDSKGFEAMEKSRGLIRGKMGVSIVIFLMLNLSLFVIQFVFQKFVIHGGSLGIWYRVGFGILCFLLLLNLFLFGLVIQTVIYFVCKSYHHENIDKSTLSDHLDVYLGEYVPLTAKDVQLEQYHV